MITFTDVSIAFKNNPLIQHLTFTAEKGDKVLLYGKSGIGKTTVFRLILGFERLQHGSICFNDQEMDSTTVWDIRKHVAYVSQDLDIGTGTVKTLLTKMLSYKANAHVRFDHDELTSLLHRFRLDESVLDDEYEKLSGGEKQRIVLISAVLLKRDIFLLDEATSSLDRELKQMTIDFFATNRDWTVLSISHDQDWLNTPGLKIVKLGT
jgi:putative ABC transport system ATP-binding protein